MLLQMFETWMPNLQEDNQPLIHILFREKASTDFIEKFKTRYDRVTVRMNEFFKRKTEKNEEERTIPGNLIAIKLKSKNLLFFDQIKRKKFNNGS